MKVLNEHEAMAWPAPCRRAPAVAPFTRLGQGEPRPPITGAPRWSTGRVVPEDDLTDFERESLEVARRANPQATVRPMCDDRGVFYLQGDFPTAPAFGRGAVSRSTVTPQRDESFFDADGHRRHCMHGVPAGVRCERCRAL